MKAERLNSKKLASVAIDALENMKGQSIRSINVQSLTEITDYMVVVTGRSTTHVKSLADAVVQDVKEAGATVVGVEGKMQSEWVLVDLGDVVVHVMMAPVRALYNLEDLWSFKADSEADSASSDEVQSEPAG